jgi:hypothetical protein
MSAAPFQTGIMTEIIASSLVLLFVLVAFYVVKTSFTAETQSGQRGFLGILFSAFSAVEPRIF